MVFPASASHIQSPAGQLELQEFDRVKNGHDPDFICGSVGTETHYRYVLSRSLVALTASDYRKVMGRDTPGSRGPKVPAMRLPADSGCGDEDHWIFADPSDPYKRLRVEASVGDVIRTETLAANDNRYQNMASNVFASSVERRQEATAAASSLLRPGAQVPELDAHLEKVNPDKFAELQEKRGEAAALQPPTAGAATEAHNAEDFSGGSFVVQSGAAPSKLLRSFSKDPAGELAATKAHGRTWVFAGAEFVPACRRGRRRGRRRHRVRGQRLEHQRPRLGLLRKGRRHLGVLGDLQEDELEGEARRAQDQGLAARLSCGRCPRSPRRAHQEVLEERPTRANRGEVAEEFPQTGVQTRSTPPIPNLCSSVIVQDCCVVLNTMGSNDQTVAGGCRCS